MVFQVRRRSKIPMIRGSLPLKLCTVMVTVFSSNASLPLLTFFSTALLLFFAYSGSESLHEGRFRYPDVPPPGASDSDRLHYSKSPTLRCPLPLSHKNPLTPTAYKIKHVAKRNIPLWLKEPLPIAHLPMENTVHYDLGTDLGILEWNNATLPGPNHDGVVWLTMKGGERKPFTFSLFHQLRCLNIVRASLMARRHPPYTEPDRLAVHCMNYLRQMVLCRADLTLESGRHPVGPNTVVSDVTRVCRDWSVIWDEVEGNEGYHRK